MNPDVATAIASLRARRVLSEPQAATLLRWARGEVVSLHWELRTALYAGVLLATTGVGLFLKDNQELVGPAAIAALLGLGAGICLLYVFRRSPPFSWQATSTPHIAVDYVLLLGVLLLGSGIAYVETQFRWLGPQWPLHLLILSVLYLTFAYRFDSRAVLSLALTSFAAWRGVTAAFPFLGGSGNFAPAVRANALGCGALFIGIGIVAARTRRKAHFEGVWVTLGLVLFLGGLLSGIFEDADWPLWAIPLFVSAGIVIALAYRLRRPLDFALGVLAAYLGMLRWLGDALSGSTLAFTIAVSSLVVLVFLIRTQRRMKETA